MTGPVRIQLSRAKGWRMPEGATKVDRSTRWGNQFKVDGTPMSNGDWEVFMCTDGRFAGPPVGHYPTKDAALTAAIEHHRVWLEGDQGDLMRQHARSFLRGKSLGCWCKIGRPCHADNWLAVANR